MHNSWFFLPFLSFSTFWRNPTCTHLSREIHILISDTWGRVEGSRSGKMLWSMVKCFGMEPPDGSRCQDGSHPGVLSWELALTSSPTEGSSSEENETTFSVYVFYRTVWNKSEWSSIFFSGAFLYAKYMKIYRSRKNLTWDTVSWLWLIRSIIHAGSVQQASSDRAQNATHEDW